MSSVQSSHLLELEQQAAACVLGLRVDAGLTQQSSVATDATPWLLCYHAFERRRAGDYSAALALGQRAVAQFQQAGDDAGHARAVAEVAIVRYHLGQFAAALNELAACAVPEHPASATALHFAAFLNQIGQDTLVAAVAAAQQGLAALDREHDEQRRVTWRIVLQRNLAAAYHYQGELAAARAAAAEAVQLAEAHNRDEYAYYWSLYEQGLLEQRAGQLDQALATLERVRQQVELSAAHTPLHRWIAVAEGHALRDMGRLDEASERFGAGGWGEGDEGPLMLWLLQGRPAEARLAAEAQLTAAHASGSPIVVTNLYVFFALLDLEAGATPAIYATLQDAARLYAEHGFWHSRASVLLHSAAAAYALGDEQAGNAALAEALRFGANAGYLNFAWWHPARMRMLLRRALNAGIGPEYGTQLLHARGLDDESPTALAIRCLDAFAVAIDGQTVPHERWRGHKAGALRMQRMLLTLARNRAPQSLDAVARYVWPDKHEEIDIATNFHVTLAALRRVLEPQLGGGDESRFVQTTPQGYQLAPSLGIAVDLDQFLAQLQAAGRAEAFGDEAAARAAYEQAEQLYAGPFALAKPAPAEAEAYQQRFHAALRWLAADDLRRNAFDKCIARAQRVLQDDRWDTMAPALLIRAYRAQGNQRAAWRQLEQFRVLHGEAGELRTNDGR